MNKKHQAPATHPLLMLIDLAEIVFTAFSGLGFLIGLRLLFQHSYGVGVFWVLATIACLACFASKKRKNKEADEKLQQRILEGEARRVLRAAMRP